MNERRARKMGTFAVVVTGLCVWVALGYDGAVTRAQKLPVRCYDVRDGLANSRVDFIYQDRKGYLWFGTREGLSRFDGYRFTNYGTREGLDHPSINAITEDQLG
jgi:ligand-binding sensor domain-containing protein